ncbi:MAG: CD1375 family protein [Vallitalea sp.]|jgi:hypothetical protein|nr:CD1375 family protein [Vallitalea sp.]
MFNEDSGIVKVWVRLVKEGKYKLEQVPMLSNLKEIVTSIVSAE